jgi:hypothetical protein
MSKRKFGGISLLGKIIFYLAHLLKRRPANDRLRTEDNQQVIVGSRFNSFSYRVSERSSREAELTTVFGGLFKADW